MPETSDSSVATGDLSAPSDPRNSQSLANFLAADCCDAITVDTSHLGDAIDFASIAKPTMDKAAHLNELRLLAATSPGPYFDQIYNATTNSGKNLDGLLSESAIIDYFASHLPQDSGNSGK